MTTFRVRWGRDAAGDKAWVLDKSGRRTQAFLTKQEAKSFASSAAQKEAAITGEPSTVVIETKSGREQTRRQVEAGQTTGFGESLF